MKAVNDNPGLNLRVGHDEISSGTEVSIPHV
jgi:hypothetical protein